MGQDDCKLRESYEPGEGELVLTIPSGYLFPKPSRDYGKLGQAIVLLSAK